MLLSLVLSSNITHVCPLKRLTDTLGQEKVTRQALMVPTNTETALASPFNPLDILNLFVFFPQRSLLACSEFGA